jgi:gamma-glutamyltranspeptidase/glutathione hydrolase
MHHVVPADEILQHRRRPGGATPSGARARVAVAAPSPLAARAGARVAADGGNAVDTALASMMVALVTEPGIVSLGGGAFVTVGPPGGTAVTIDGYVEMPGRGLPPDAFGRGVREVVTAYGGHTAMTVGHGSVATPGVLAAVERAHGMFGRVPWRSVVEPARDAARDGFGLGAASDYYFGYSRELVFGHDPDIRAALYHPDGSAVRTGEPVHIPDLADFLDRIADEGAGALYTGDVAKVLAADMAEHGGLVTQDDLAAYEPVVRRAIGVDLGAWQLATNPPPAIGGPVLAAMLLLLGERPQGAWTPDDAAHLVTVVRAVLRHRAHELDVAADRASAGQALLDDVLAHGQAWLGVAPSTAHVSAVDADGLACAVTASSGYGAGVTVPGTGVWLNNCLGEHELNHGGLHSLPPGERLASNMAPTVARRADGAALAVGSPGADRITTALTQVIASFAHGGYDLAGAVDRPRLHVGRTQDGTETLHHEPGLEISDTAALAGLPRREHEPASMYFGGVGAVLRAADGTLVAAADPRRAGAVAYA